MTAPALVAENDNAGLKVVNLRKSYKNRLIIRDVTLDLARGEVVGLLGPNGSGKTTTIDCEPSDTIENIKHNEGAVFLPHRKTPTGADTAALVPVLPEAMQILTEAAQGRSEGRVWPYNSQSVSTAWARAATAVGLKGLRLHDMRRAATTDLAKIGLSAPLIQTVTGHKSLSSLQHYLAISPEDFHKAYANAKRQSDE